MVLLWHFCFGLALLIDFDDFQFTGAHFGFPSLAWETMRVFGLLHRLLLDSLSLLFYPLVCASYELFAIFFDICFHFLQFQPLPT
jgi:hypothetical protein